MLYNIKIIENVFSHTKTYEYGIKIREGSKFSRLKRRSAGLVRRKNSEPSNFIEKLHRKYEILLKIALKEREIFKGSRKNL
jgi:hypothetical protein